MKNLIVIIASAWGPKFGGINAFNMDFTLALGRVLGEGRVVCAVPSAGSKSRKEAASAGVQLLALGCEDGLNDPQEVVEALGENLNTDGVGWWVGHDVISGHIANLAKKRMGGRAAVFQHMSYRLYSTFKSGSGDRTREQEERQAAVAKGCDRLFGVEPLLTEEACSMRGTEDGVWQIVPGLAEIEPNRARPANSFDAMVVGRITEEDDVIKQGMAAVKGFGQAVKKICADDTGKACNLSIFGLSKEDEQYKKEAEAIRQAADDEAGRMVNVIPMRFSDERQQVFERLACQHACLMPSLHEGFGLVAWEAIAAEVPLVISHKSGAYRLLKEDHPGLTGLVRGVDIVGTDADTTTLKKELCSIERHYLEMAQHAGKLKAALMEHGYTWENAACTFLEACAIAVSNTMDGDHSVEEEERFGSPEDIVEGDSGRQKAGPEDAIWQEVEAEIAGVLKAPPMKGFLDEWHQVLKKKGVQPPGEPTPEDSARTIMGVVCTDLLPWFDQAYQNYSKKAEQEKGDFAGTVWTNLVDIVGWRLLLEVDNHWGEEFAEKHRGQKLPSLEISVQSGVGAEVAYSRAQGTKAGFLVSANKGEVYGEKMYHGSRVAMFASGPQEEDIVKSIKDVLWNDRYRGKEPPPSEYSEEDNGRLNSVIKYENKRESHCCCLINSADESDPFKDTDILARLRRDLPDLPIIRIGVSGERDVLLIDEQELTNALRQFLLLDPNEED